jgi:serine/threonine-protein kinase
MELLDGMTLKQLLDELKIIPLERALAIARQICSALEAVHAKGIVHRDLKPENIFLSQKEGKDFVKLLDFGAAKLTRLQDERLRFQTMAGSLVGTPRYMAPEQTYGGEVDQRTDVYAIGLLLYEMLTGTSPFDGETTTEILLKHRNHQPPPAPKQIRESVRALIDRCLQKAPEDRPQNMTELIAALGSTTSPGRSRVPAMIAGVAVVLFAGAVAAYSLPKQTAPAVLPPPSPAPIVPPPVDVEITFKSQPSGADVLLDGAPVGVTPLRRRWPRSSNAVTYEVKLEGYQSRTDVVHPKGDATIDVALAELPKPVKPRPLAKRIKKKRPRPAPKKPEPDPKKEIGLGDMRDPDWDK